MIRLKTLIVLLFCAFSTSISAQSKQLKNADQQYKLNNFAEAIPAYEAALQEKYSLSAETKLAKCFFMLNKMDKAEKLYAKIVKNNKAKPLTYFNYAETLMSKSKYDEAKVWFKKYLEDRPNDVNAKTKLLACDMVQTIQPHFLDVNVNTFQFNSEFDDTAPVIHSGDLVFASDRKIGVKLLKQKSGWTGRDYINIYSSTKTDQNEFGEPVPYSKFNGINKNTGSVSFSSDGKEAFFTRNGDLSNRKEEYTMQLYKAESEDGKKWKSISPLAFCKVEYNYMHPTISADGQRLFFVTDKPGGEGGTDIYFCDRKSDGTWSKPQNIGPIINTEGNEGYPFLTKDSKLYFCSKGHAGFGGFDIFYSEQKESGLWKKPINVGKPINSSSDDISLFLLDDSDQGWFTSSRTGGDDDIFQFSFSSIASSVSYSAYDDDQADHSIFSDEPDAIVLNVEKREEEVAKPKTYSEIIAQQNASQNKVDEAPISNQEVSNSMDISNVEKDPATISKPKENLTEAALNNTAPVSTSILTSQAPKEPVEVASEVLAETQQNNKNSVSTPVEISQVEKESQKTSTDLLVDAKQKITALDSNPIAIMETEVPTKQTETTGRIKMYQLERLPPATASDEMYKTEMIVKEEEPKRPKTYSEIIAMQNQGGNVPVKKEMTTKKEEEESMPPVVAEQVVSAEETFNSNNEEFELPDFKEEEIPLIQNELAIPSTEIENSSDNSSIESISDNKSIVDKPSIDVSSENLKEQQKEELNDFVNDVLTHDDEQSAEKQVDMIVQDQIISETETVGFDEFEKEFDELIEPAQPEKISQTDVIDSPARSSEPQQLEETMHYDQEKVEIEKIAVKEPEILEPEVIIFDTKNNELDTKIISENDLLVNEVIEPKPVQTNIKKSKSKAKTKSLSIPVIEPTALNVPASGVYIDERGVDVLSNDLFVKNVKIGHTYQIPNADYGFNKIDTPIKLSFELDKLVSVLQKYTAVSVELVGHTASFGEQENNLQLSIKRAKAAADYLIRKGISQDRITFTGFGENQLRNNCIDGVLCSLDEHKENERLEMVITRFQ